MVWLTRLCLYELFHFPANFRSAAPLFTINISNPVKAGESKKIWSQVEWSDRQSFDSEELWHCDIFVTIHYHFNTFSLNIEYIGWRCLGGGEGAGGRACHTLDFCRWKTFFKKKYFVTLLVFYPASAPLPLCLTSRYYCPIIKYILFCKNKLN